MNRIRTAIAGDLKNAISPQVRIHRRSGSKAVSLIRMLHMQCAAIRIGIDGNRRDAQLAAGAKQTQRDLAAIGNQDFAKGRHQ